MKTVAIGNYKVGAGHPLLVMAGPCVLEGYERSLMIGRRAKAICEKVGLPYVSKLPSIKQIVRALRLSAARVWKKGLKS